jgi:predicted acetyltransferase
MYTGMKVYGSIDLFNWKIQENYVSKGIINLIKDGTKIVATTSLTPKFLYFKGNIQIVAEIGDTYTHPDYQRKGLFSSLINQTREDAEHKGISFIYGTPNEQSLPGYEKKANFKKINNINVHSMLLPVNISPIVSSKLNWVLGNVIGYFYLIYILCLYKLKKITNNKYSKKEVIEIETLPKDWDDFWEKAHVHHDFILTRDLKAIQWRFINHPNKYRLYILRQHNELIGYLIYRVLSEKGINNLVIADFLMLNGKELYLQSLLLRVIKDSIAQSVTKISLWCPQDSPYFKILKNFGFISRGTIPVIC